MITDDQVATLLRDAGNAGPLPSPLDPAAAVARARTDRTRSRALAGLAVAVAVIGLVVSRSTPLGSEAAGGGSAGDPSTSYVTIGLAVLALVALVTLACAVAVPFVLRLPVQSRRRTVLASFWGAVGLSVVGLSAYPVTTFLVWPRVLLDGFHAEYWLVVAGGTVVLVGLAALALLARRRLRPGSLRPLSGALWLLLAYQAGSWLTWIAYLQVLEPSVVAPGQITPFEPESLVAFAAVVAGALAAGAGALRREPRRWSRVPGATVLVAAAGAIGGWAGLLLDLRWSVGFLLGGPFVIVGLLLVTVWAIGAAGARLAVGPAVVHPWTTSLLAVPALAAALAAGLRALVALQTTARIGMEQNTLVQAVWAAVLAVLAVVLVHLVDRRSPLP